MARIDLNPPSTVFNRLAGWYSTRRYGAVLDPVAAMGHNRRVAMSAARFERSVTGWDALDPTLKALAVTASAQRIGCSWCIDFGHWIMRNEGVDPAKLREVPRWRESDVFTPLERDVIEYAETMSGEIAEVTDEMVTSLRTRLGEAALVELTMMVAVENQRARFNAALGLTSQGFVDHCEMALA